MPYRSASVRIVSQISGKRDVRNDATRWRHRASPPHKMSRNRLHAGHIDDHVKANSGPDRDGRDRPENGVDCRARPAQAVKPDRAQRAVKQPDIRVIDIAPENADDDGRNNLRKEEDDPIESRRRGSRCCLA